MKTEIDIEKLQKDLVILKNSKHCFEYSEYRKKYNSLHAIISDLKNPAKARERSKKSRGKWALNNPDKLKESIDKFKKNNPNYHRDYLREWKLENPERVRFLNLRWVRNNPFKIRLFSIRAREQSMHVNTSITEQDLIDIKEKFNHRCFNCGSEKRLVYDHFYPIQIHKLPLSKENCVLLCNTCNFNRKRGMDPELFFSPDKLKELFYDIGIKRLGKNKQFVSNTDKAKVRVKR